MQLHRDRERFDAAGARLVLIGQGTPAHAQHFREEYDLDGLEVLVDPDRAAYKVAGAKVATVSELLGVKSVVAGIKRAKNDGVRQGAVQGHPAQLGGVLVVAKGGKIAWAHMADNAGDNAPNDDVLAAVERAKAA